MGWREGIRVAPGERLRSHTPLCSPSRFRDRPVVFPLRRVGSKNRCTRDFRTEVSRARYYSPQIGRLWTQDDGEHGDQEDPKSLHLYTYCESDPVNNIDPSGNEVEAYLAAMNMGITLYAANSPGPSRVLATVAVSLRARPNNKAVRQLVAAIYAESGSKDWSGAENAVEKLAIGATIVNQAFYAKLPPGSKPKRRNYNKSFGDGTVLGAIKRSIVAYKQTEWNQVADADDLKPDPTISGTLVGTAREHYNLSVDAANAVTTAPMAIKELGSRCPIGFNKSQKHKAPSKERDDFIGGAGVHMFYGFKTGREYE